MKLTKNQLKELVRKSIYDTISEANEDRYVHIGYGKYKEKGKEKDKKAPTFKKTDDGKFVSFKGDDKPKGKEKPKPTKKSFTNFCSMRDNFFGIYMLLAMQHNYFQNRGRGI